MISFSLQLSESAIVFLKWIQAGCQHDEYGLWSVVSQNNQYIRIVRKLLSLGFIVHHKNADEKKGKPLYTLTRKGELALALVLMDMNNLKTDEDLKNGKHSKHSRPRK